MPLISTSLAISVAKRVRNLRVGFRRNGVCSMDLRVRLRFLNPAGKRQPQTNRVTPKANALLFRNFPGGIGSCFRRPQENDQVSDLPHPLSATSAAGEIQLLLIEREDPFPS